MQRATCSQSSFNHGILEAELSLRKVVSDGGRFYDPIGLALPIAMTSRIIQQLCWAEGQGWDATLPPNLQAKWKQWATQATRVHNLSIPRAVRATTANPIKQRIIIFVDASAEAQAAVAYIQSLYSTGELQARLLTARGKVTSLRKQESIPRLECLAASMGAELGAKLNHLLGWNMEDTVYFSDSTTTLWWLRTTKPLKVFVANRVCNVLDASKAEQWAIRPIRTTIQQTSLPRTTTVKGLGRSKLWWWGPEFLQRPEKEWPAQPKVTTTNEGLEETRDVEKILQKIHVHRETEFGEQAQRQNFLRHIWGKYAEPRKGLRVTAVVYRAWEIWMQALQRELPRTLQSVSNSSHSWNWQKLESGALNFLIRGDQEKALTDVIQDIEQNKPQTRRYACWRLFMDEHQLLRINGRLAMSKTVTPSARTPIFLTADMPMAKELFRLTHDRLKHAGGSQTLLSEVRQRYWVDKGQKLAKQVLKECGRCNQRQAREVAHHTAPLHYSRETAPVGKVFHSIGIDMFGPMEVTQGRGKARGKRYGLIFTCGFSRAINVEVMRDATAESCLMAFKRHAAIYGQPQYVNSDQGTNLQYVRKVLHEIHTAWEDALPELKENFPGVIWGLNPPYTPSYGGHYESLIKVLKNAFKHTAKWPRYSFTDEQLVTGLKEAAAIANMRPLTELSTDPNDPPPIRPSDFLHAPILGVTPDWRNSTLHRRIKNELEAFQQELWIRMRKEVLSTLQKPRHWEPKNPLQEGDLVLVKDDDWRPRPLAVGKDNSCLPREGWRNASSEGKIHFQDYRSPIERSCA